MIRVGKPGDVGSVELSDLLFTAVGPTAGLVAMEWNLKAKGKGTAAMWGEVYCYAVLLTFTDAFKIVTSGSAALRALICKRVSAGSFLASRTRVLPALCFCTSHPRQAPT